MSAKRKVGRAAPTLGDRRAGVLLHPTSLATRFSSGDIGPSARAFIDGLAEAGFSWWQMLPVNPIGDGDSPYSTISTFAGEALLISPDDLAEAGLLERSALKRVKSTQASRVDYKAARLERHALLKRAFAKFEKRPALVKAAQAFRARCRWFDDFALFQALSERFGTSDFAAWPKPFAKRDAKALKGAALELAPSINYNLFIQWQFDAQWQALKEYALARGVGLIGDLPIFVSCRSADVWAARELFCLDGQGRPTVVAGCPPDQFNADGQLWGNALYDWAEHERQRFGWWTARLSSILTRFDAVRLDHFIGFTRYWEIPAGAKDARGGTWKRAPGAKLFRALEKKLGPMPFIAEDLGAVTPEVRELRDQFSFPGMKVLQFAFDGTTEAREHEPHFYSDNAAAYTGTHDNDTARGWLRWLKQRAKASRAAALELERASAYLGIHGTLGDSRGHEAMVRTVFQSRANLAVIPLQDLLGQGSSARMNVPGVAKGNWRYRMPKGALTDALTKELRLELEVFGRKPTAKIRRSP